jgi:hypothetical protein
VVLVAIVFSVRAVTTDLAVATLLPSSPKSTVSENTLDDLPSAYGFGLSPSESFPTIDCSESDPEPDEDS